MNINELIKWSQDQDSCDDTKLVDCLYKMPWLKSWYYCTMPMDLKKGWSTLTDWCDAMNLTHAEDEPVWIDTSAISEDIWPDMEPEYCAHHPHLYVTMGRWYDKSGNYQLAFGLANHEDYAAFRLTFG